MSNIRHILRLYNQSHSKLEISRETGMPRIIVKKIVTLFTESKLSFEEVNQLPDKDLEDLFGKHEENPMDEKLSVLYSLFPEMNRELKKKGVTRMLLFDEYKKKHPDGIGKNKFLEHFAQWKSSVTPIMRVKHKPGDKLYIDFAGEKLSITDRQTGKSKQVEVFVAVLGGSQLTYVEAVLTQTKQDFIPACERALQYIGGVPAAIVPDNLRTAVSKSDRYEPTINETFSDFAEHYGTTILPARAYRPTDKALVEIAIRIIYTRIYAKLRGREFFSLAELNEAILLDLEDHNNQVMTGRNASRRQLFEDEERKMLHPLPSIQYEFKRQYWATVTKNGHVAIPEDKHYYSVPYRYIGRNVKVMYTRTDVYIFHNYERVARHKRDMTQFRYTTDQEHLAVPFRYVNEWKPEHFLAKAGEIHKDVKLFIAQILNHKRHPEQAYKVCEGVLNLSRKVGNVRLAKACQRALSFGLYNYRTVLKILEKGLDNDGSGEHEELDMPQHDNIRGGNYYQ